jgi:hypothetical protein
VNSVVSMSRPMGRPPHGTLQVRTSLRIPVLPEQRWRGRHGLVTRTEDVRTAYETTAASVSQ